MQEAHVVVGIESDLSKSTERPSSRIFCIADAIAKASCNSNTTTMRALLCGVMQEDRARILDGANHEVGKVLRENLYDKFRATKQYVEINDMMFSTAVEHSSGPI